MLYNLQVKWLVETDKMAARMTEKGSLTAGGKQYGGLHRTRDISRTWEPFY